jgi:hypothetical protein
MPIAVFAHDLLARRVRKAGKQGRDLEPLSPEERHKLRIRMKKDSLRRRFLPQSLSCEGEG